MNNPRNKPVTTTVVVTPAMATAWLMKNTANRPLVMWRVNALKRAILAGEWRYTHQGIAFDKNGVLQDGQHRLKAVAESGRPVEMLVTRNCDPEAFKVIDTGARRSIADSLAMEPKRAEVLARIGRLGGYKSDKINAAFVERLNTAFGDEVTALHSYHSGNARYFSAAPIKASAVVRMARYPDQIEYVGNTYSALCKLRFEDLPQGPAGFARAVIAGRVDMRAQTDLSLRAWKVFDPEHAGDTRIQIREQSDPIGEIRDAIDLILASKGV
jgi:hypothetical protein